MPQICNIKRAFFEVFEEYSKRISGNKNSLRQMTETGINQFGGSLEVRTPDPLIKSQVLYRLS